MAPMGASSAGDRRQRKLQPASTRGGRLADFRRKSVAGLRRNHWPPCVGLCNKKPNVLNNSGFAATRANPAERSQRKKLNVLNNSESGGAWRAHWSVTFPQRHVHCRRVSVERQEPWVVGDLAPPIGPGKRVRRDFNATARYSNGKRAIAPRRNQTTGNSVAVAEPAPRQNLSAPF